MGCYFAPRGERQTSITRDRAIAATVRMREVTKPEDEGWSGVLADKDGLIITCAQILTKASAFAKAPSCRLADGRTKSARIIRVSRKDDTALLRIAAADLPVIEGWDLKRIPSIGMLLALPTPTGTAVVGSVTCAARSIPPSPKGEEFHHDGFPNAYEVGIPSVPVLNGGPVIDAMGSIRGVAVAKASDGWLIVIPSSSAHNLLHD
jgi:S1-C subfamily serine protease